MYYAMNTLSIRVPDELRADLQQISRRQNKPVSDVVRESIRRYVAIEKFRALRQDSEDDDAPSGIARPEAVC